MDELIIYAGLIHHGYLTLALLLNSYLWATISATSKSWLFTGL